MEKLGVADAERLITLLARNDTDCIAWQREYSGGMEQGQVLKDALFFEEGNPYSGGAKVV